MAWHGMARLAESPSPDSVSAPCPYSFYTSAYPSQKSYAIIDVRDDDYHGQKIKGSLHFPYATFRPEQLIQRLALAPNATQPTNIVFHCHYSAVRGPSAAKRLATFLASNESSCSSLQRNLKVHVLKGGFKTWSELYSGHSDLIESIDNNHQ